MTKKVEKYYMIGIGGIGMSAIASYLLLSGSRIFGYDKVNSKIVKRLINQGAKIIFSNELDLIPKEVLDGKTMIIYSAAISKENKQLIFFKKHKYKIFKRSEFLSKLTNNSFCIAVSGTHGKTTTSGILTHLFLQNKVQFTSLIGGLLSDKKTNMVCTGNKYIIVEADEYDKSFLHLNPAIACITSIDVDHMDIYKDSEDMKKTFIKFSKLISKSLIVEKSLGLKGKTYSIKQKADYYVKNISCCKNGYEFDLYSPELKIENVFFNQIGKHNLSNAVAAFAMASEAGLDQKKLAKGLSNFPGIERRLQIVYNKKNKVLIDDYAHHPIEIKAFYKALQENFPKEGKCVFFQPHLFSRTRDFMNQFAKVLEYFDRIYLLEIYPARELPIDGVNSEKLGSLIKRRNVMVIKKNQILDIVKNVEERVVSFLGAGDIGNEIDSVKNYFNSLRL